MAQSFDASIYVSLRRNMIAAVVAVSLAPLFCIDAILIYHYHVVYKDMVGERLSEVAAGRARGVDGDLGDKIAMLRFLAVSYPASELAGQEFMDTCLARFGQSSPGTFEDLGLIDEDGLQTAYAGPHGLRGARYENAPWFSKALAAPETVSDVFTGYRGQPHFVVTVRLAEPGGRSFVLRATADQAHFAAMLGEARAGKTGAAFLVNASGAVQARAGEGDDLFPGAVQTILGSAIRPGKAAFFEIEGATGKDYVYAAAPLARAGWTLILRQDASDAMAQLISARIQSAIIFVAGVMGIVLVAALISARTVERLADSERRQQSMRDKIVETGKLAAVGELAAGVAHEINNPVAIMIEEAGWIRDQLDDGAAASAQSDAELRRSVDEIVTQGKRCREITHKLLSFARKTEGKPERVDLARVVTEIAGLARQKAKFAGVALDVTVRDGLPEACLSVSELQQILLNLVNNAIDAVAKAGRADGWVRVSLAGEGGRIVISVADNGEGMTPEVRSRIFEPFFTTKPAGEGTGLGLSICHGLVSKMGGEFTVESEPGLGSIFGIVLPAEPSKACAIDETGPAGRQNA